MLYEVGTILVDIHGQFDSRSLVSADTHIHVLDQFGHKKVSVLTEEYSKQLNLFKETMQQLKRYALSETELQRKIDILEYQVQEIESASLKEHEEEDLIKQKSFLANAEKILNALQSANELLFDGEFNAESMLEQSASLISSISEFKKEFGEMETTLKDMTYSLEDVKYSLMQLMDHIDFDPGQLDALSDRLEAIKSLKKKYGNNIPDILKYCKEAKEELELLKNSEDIMNRLRNRMDLQKKQLYEIATQIHVVRKETAVSLENKIAKELDDMEMKKVLFQVSVDFPDYEQVGDTTFSENGLDSVEFLISPNQGEELKPLAKIASGGELSRIMLAFKTLLSDRNKIPVMIFDEIDAGISGEAALQTGRKIYEISKNCQVICVTHMPQIACMADTHFVIRKENIEGNSFTFIQELEHENRADQLASLLDGNKITESGLAHANDMLEKAEEYKSQNIIC
ncbi:MAG TPA: DNA repair protein RecN [Clostridiales bacterium]|nr:DNA repair protein RecN [Clostridiales bacterium]